MENQNESTNLAGDTSVLERLLWSEDGPYGKTMLSEEESDLLSAQLAKQGDCWSVVAKIIDNPIHLMTKNERLLYLGEFEKSRISAEQWIEQYFDQKIGLWMEERKKKLNSVPALSRKRKRSAR